MTQSKPIPTAGNMVQSILMLTQYDIRTLLLPCLKILTALHYLEDRTPTWSDLFIAPLCHSFLVPSHFTFQS